MNALPPFDDECFFIAPIGSKGEETRKRSDNILNFIVAPAAEELGLTAVRADLVATPGLITHQVIEHVLRAKAVVADLTGSNANVYYELAIRHAAHLPVALIADADQTLPFDISGMRTILFDVRDLAEADACKNEVTAHLRSALDGQVDSPIAAALRLEQLAQGTPVEQTVADLAGQVERVGQQVRVLSLQVHKVISRSVPYKRNRLSAEARRRVESGDSISRLIAQEESARDRAIHNVDAWTSPGDAIDSAPPPDSDDSDMSEG